MRPVWGHVVNTMLEEVLRASPCAPPLRCPTPLPPSFKFLKPQTGRHACTYYLHTNRCLRKPQDWQSVPAPYLLQYLRCLRLSLPLPGSRAGGQEARRCVTTATAHHHHHHHHAIATAHNPSQFARWPGEAPIVVTPSEGIALLLQTELRCGTQRCTPPKSAL